MFPFIVVTTQDFTHRSKSKVRGTVHDSVIVSRSLTGIMIMLIMMIFFCRETVVMKI